MPAFAAWIGRMAAAVAAILAVVWLIEAMPPGAMERERLTSACRRAALNLPTPLAIVTEANACETRFTGWDDALATRGLLAGGAAVALLLLTAMVPKPAPAIPAPPPRPAPLSFAELARRVEHEIADHKRLTGRDLPEEEARRRVAWRHDQGLHREPGR
jgi:hypothetical protein